MKSLTRRKLPDMDQIPEELIKTEGIKFRFEIHKLINYICKKGGIASGEGGVDNFSCL
jgi:hypothetical protein